MQFGVFGVGGAGVCLLWACPCAVQTRVFACAASVARASPMVGWRSSAPPAEAKCNSQLAAAAYLSAAATGFPGLCARVARARLDEQRDSCR
eukprot:12318805-Alexandrium_andersonii.AAC.1